MKMTEEEWDLIISVHLKGAFCVTQPAIKVMKGYNYGRIVSGDGVCIGDAKRPIEVEEIRDNFEKISDLSNPREHDSVRGVFGYMIPLFK